MTLPTLTEAMVREGAAAETFRRGQEYHREGAVGEITRRGDLLQAEVEGSDIYPYTISVRADAAGLIEAGCTCPYDWGGWCKHIVAVLLTLIDDPQSVEERPSLDTLLAEAGEDQLRNAVRRLVEMRQVTTETIEALLAQPAPAPAATLRSPVPAPAKNMSAAVKAARREVRDEIQGLNRFSSSEAYWQVSGVVDGVRSVLTQVTGYLNDGDAPAALAILDAITDEYLSDWEEMDDSDGDASAFFYDLNPIWAEALLSADLDAAARANWTKKLKGYARNLREFGVDDVFDSALAAIAEGWDAPEVQKALAGEPLELSEEDEEDESWDDLDEDEDDLFLPDGGVELTHARLNVLERQGRFDEFLNYAGVSGIRDRRSTMLVRLGRADEALAYGLGQLRTAEEALSLSRAFREQNDAERALRVAEHGLSLPSKWDSYRSAYSSTAPRPGELAIWTRDLASELGQSELALRAARIAFEHELNLGSYLRAKEIAGESWDTLRPDLLTYLREHRSVLPEGHIDVFLHEGLIGDAVAAVEDVYEWHLKARVADAATATHPEWVAATGRRIAFEIMDEGQSSHYDEAVAWLARAGAAERVLGHIDSWRSELDGLIAKHMRKYKLRPMLENLRRRT